VPAGLTGNGRAVDGCGTRRPGMNPSSHTLSAMIDAATNVVAFTGAGLSTECGIPDFRSPGGLWSQFRPIDFDTFMSSPAARREALTRFMKIREAMGPARPGRGHRAIARLAAAGKVSAVVTQNIDGLHQASGVAADRIVELHGNGTYAHCLACGTRHELDWVAAELERQPGAPACTACGGIVKTATISFGQSLPPEVLVRAQAAAEACDLLLAIGSSLQVYPAAGIPLLAARAGARLAIINREPTGFDAMADLVIHDDIGDTLEVLNA
jgi:NAD-dependent protein deacetylase/lipoamidase